MDTIQATFEELSLLKVVFLLENNMLRVDLGRLANLGYILILWNNEPTFYKITDVQRYLYNPIIYTESVIPISSLKTYNLIKLKDDYSSF